MSDVLLNPSDWFSFCDRFHILSIKADVVCLLPLSTHLPPLFSRVAAPCLAPHYMLGGQASVSNFSFVAGVASLVFQFNRFIQETRLKNNMRTVFSGGARGGGARGGKCPPKLFFAPPFCPPSKKCISH